MAVCPVCSHQLHLFSFSGCDETGRGTWKSKQGEGGMNQHSIARAGAGAGAAAATTSNY